MDINSVYKWFGKKGLKINENKTKHLRIAFKKVDLNNYTINKTEIETVENHKHLGVILDNKLNFNKHIDYIVIKAYKKFAMLKRLCAQADGYIFLRLYKSYILSILENCNLGIFLSKTNCHRLECVQKKVTNFVCYKQGKNDLKYDDRLKYLSLNSIEDRKFIRGLKFL